MFRLDPTATRQYVLVYPSFQYITTRQDEGSTTGFYEALQNYFFNFGNSQNDENSHIMDPIDADKPQASATPTESSLPQATPTADTSSPDKKPDAKQKVFYSYLTPASTVPLNADRRLYFLAEQPQIFGTFSGPSVNPVFNLQPVPILSSRSNVVQTPVDQKQSDNVVLENVQKSSQVPPVLSNVIEQPSQVLLAKSNIIEQSDAVVRVDQAENRVAPVVVDNRAIPVSTEQTQSLELKSTEAQVVEARSNSIPLTVSEVNRSKNFIISIP